MPIRKRISRPALSPTQRRQQIISILSSALASMPLATAVPAKQANESGRKKLSEKPPTGLEVPGH